MSLSGGQRQRLSLARAILAAPKILVLDDTLSALDVHTEAVVEEALRRVLHAVTGIVVAHRASTVLLADKVALLDDGVITHVGTHELLAAVQYLSAGRRRRTRRRPRACLQWQEDDDRHRLDHIQRAGSTGTRARRAQVRHLGGRGSMSITEWRGRFDEDQDDDLPIDESLPRRREARALLGSLLRPYSRTVALLALVVVVENAARLSVPILVQRGIDRGIPPIVDGGSAHTLMLVVATLAGVVLVQAVSRVFFLRRSGRVGQKVLTELRRRVFRHFQRLDIRFHDRYTSGRVVSRSTNDVEAIQDMLETGFDSMITAALTLVGTSILLVTLDVRLGLMCLVAVPILVALVWWFRNESAKVYRKVRESAALVIVQFVETMTGIKAVQAYRREPRNQEIFEDVADDYREINEKTFRLLAIFMPGVKLVGNLTTSVVLLYGGYRVLHGETIGTLAAFLLCGCSSNRCRRSRSSSIRSSPHHRRWRSWRVCSPSGRASAIRSSPSNSTRSAVTSRSTMCSSRTSRDVPCCRISTSWCLQVKPSRWWAPQVRANNHRETHCALL
ncbi:hypothetical protein MGAD_59110 [Mycolicibacterium gadium]|uniref:ABC transmembrane type-1 domain-containing protein n=1 Tax=Mycolicibacterium gadium TaxID=1794 RepID=A0A7I7WVB0_MYCGU|nr:hypothetical protein MGAD_59110 [Mycolicibacterium gadium]